MKKFLAILLAAVMLTAVACASAQTINTKDSIRVGVVQLVDMHDSDLAYEGMCATIADALGDKVTVVRQSAAGDPGNMATIIQGFVDEQYDLIVPILTPPCQAAVSICGGEIPIIFMSVVDPVYSKIVPSWDTVSPEYKATGTSNTIPADKILETANTITPLTEGKKICILYNTSQNNSQCTMEAAVAHCDAMGYPYDVVGYTDVPDALTQINALDPDAYAFSYVTLDSAIATNFNQVGAMFVEMGIPCYGAADAMPKGGGFCSYGVNYTIVGNMTGAMIVDWFNGKDLEQMPVQRYSDFVLVVNSDVQTALGIELPADMVDGTQFVTTIKAN